MPAATQVDILDSWLMAGPDGRKFFGVLAKATFAVGTTEVIANSLKMARVLHGSWAMRQADDRSVLLVPSYSKGSLLIVPFPSGGYFNPVAVDAATAGDYTFTATGFEGI